MNIIKRMKNDRNYEKENNDSSGSWTVVVEAYWPTIFPCCFMQSNTFNLREKSYFPHVRTYAHMDIRFSKSLAARHKIFLFFLDASSHLYKRVCPSVRRSVGPSVRWSVGHAFSINEENTSHTAYRTPLRTHRWPDWPCFNKIRVFCSS